MSPDAEKARNILAESRRQQQALLRMKERLRELREQAVLSGGMQDGGMGGGGGTVNSRVERLTIKALDLQQEIAEMQAREDMLLTAIRQAVEQISDEREKMILQYRYLEQEKMPWMELQERVYASRRTCMRMHEKALLSFAKTFYWEEQHQSA